MDRFFPAPILDLPRADIPPEGPSAYRAEVDDYLSFMTFDEDATLPEQVHGPQVGFVLEGLIDLQINSGRTNFETSDIHYMPAKVSHAEEDRYSAR